MPPQSSPALPLNVTPSGNAPGTRPTAAASAAPSTTANTVKAPVNPSDISSPHELTAFVESLLEQLDAKFDDMSSQILDRMNQMSSRVDALEVSIQDIINSDATAVPPSPSVPQSPPIVRRNSGGS